MPLLWIPLFQEILLHGINVFSTAVKWVKDTAMKKAFTVLDSALYQLIILVLTLLAMIPRRWADVLAGHLGNLWFRLDKRHRRITLSNLTSAYGHQLSSARIEQLATDAFIHFIQTFIRIARFRNLGLNHFSRWFTINGMSHYHAAARKGKGVLFLTGHLGTWELFPFFYGHTGLVSNAASVYRPLRSPALERFITDIRQRFGGTMYPLKGALKGIVSTLQHQGTALLLMDQSTKPHKGVAIRFFNRPAFANKGMARLALETGAPVVPMFLVRHQGRYCILIEPEIPFIDTGDETVTLQVNTQRYNHAIETMVNRYPGQYFWMHNRWKHRVDA